MVRDLNRVIKLKGHCIRTTENVTFLRRCLDAYVTPVHIKKRVQKAKPKHPWAIERAFLRDELNKHQDILKQTIEDYRRTLQAVRRELSFFDQLRFCKLVNQTSDRLREQTRKEKDGSLKRLRRAQLGNAELDHSIIVNLADIDLTDVQKDAPYRGLNFGIPPKTDNIVNEVEAEFELFWGQLVRQTPTSDDQRRSCKTSMAHFARKYATQKVDRTGHPFRKEHYDAIRELKKEKDIVITRPDKGNGVVILRRDDYISKMEQILSQKDKFERIGAADENDNTQKQEQAISAFLRRAVANKHLPAEVYDRISPVGSTRPRMYGLPKIHKPDVPLRPILSMVNAPQHAMAGWLTEVLRPVLEKYSERTIRDSFHFCGNLDDFMVRQAPSGTFMCSFDVVSLFTNIPLAETIQICLDTLYRDDDVTEPSIPEDLLRKLLLKATTEVEFSFDDVIYKQVDGVAMGSPLGPVLANIFVGYCESKFEAEVWPLLYNRFVDDTFCIFHNQGESRDFFHVLNGLHPALCFTVEFESDNRLPFMDVLVQRHGDEFLRSIYRKPTFTGLYTQWDSFAPSSQKIALVRSLTSRAVRICSPVTLPDELAKLKTLFGKNGYPSHVVDRIIRETVLRTTERMEANRCCEEKMSITNSFDPDDDPEPKPPDPGEERKDPEPERAILRLPWLGNVSNQYRKQITAEVTSCYPGVKPIVVFSTRSAFNGRAKDVLPATLKSNVVYHFTCSCGLTYVGRTSHCLSERIQQHIPSDLLKRKRTSDSAITKHLRLNADCLSEDLNQAFRVLASARNSTHLNVLEALFIKRLAPPLCSQKEHVRALSLF